MNEARMTEPGFNESRANESAENESARNNSIPPNGASGIRSENVSPAATAQTAVLEVSQQHQASASAVQLWMHRISVFLFVLISAIAGVLLIILPWTPEWTDNSLLGFLPGLRTVIANGFTRGLCSGLGLLDIWIGFWEALHYHEPR
jgi:hypothetical protein